MSPKALWSQATHTLTIIGQKDPELKHIKILHDGPLSDLLEAIMKGTLPSRDEVRKFYGLTPTILELVSMVVVVPATTSKFVASEQFKLKNNGGICSYLGDNFLKWFGEKIEEPSVETALQYYKLLKDARDLPQKDGETAIIPTLGGEEKVETTLTEIRSLMANQANGEEGVLLNNGWTNIFYVRDVAGVLRAVRVYWRGGGWGVNADSVESPFGWDAVSQVFSRKVLESFETLAQA